MRRRKLVISVASGKGGTGKTTITANMAWAASTSERVVLLDCDVEEPDSHFYLKSEWSGETEVSVPAPVVDSARCDGCGRCAEFCRFNALAAIKGDVLVFQELCHGCGGCSLACPLKCITYADRRIGVVRRGDRGGVSLFQGLLDIGEPIAVPVIEHVKENRDERGLTLIDCPPGTGCPMVNSIRGSDYCVLVTEPSPFGRHDLNLAHLAAVELGIAHGVVISRSSDNDGIIEEYCSGNNLKVIGRIPYSRSVALACSRGEMLAETDTAWRERFMGILQEVRKECQLSLRS
jgi:MinD superfamily P-loop ATPase